MDLEYTIKTKAELAGAEAFADSLEKQIGKAKAMKQDFSELQRQLDLVNESMKGAHLPAEQEIADTAKLEIGKRELLESLRGITKEFPLLGEAARAVFNPITAVVGSLTMMIGGIFEALKKVEDMELPDLTAGIDQAEQLGAAWDGIGPAVQEADDAFKSFGEAHSRALKAITDELQATKDLITATKERALAELNVQRAGGMDQGEYERKKGIIERGANDQTIQAENDARTKKLAADQAEAAAAEAAAKAAADKLAHDKGAPSKEVAEAEIAAEKKVEEEARKRQQDAAKRRESIQDTETDRASAKSYGAYTLAKLETAADLIKSLFSMDEHVYLTKSAPENETANAEANRKIEIDSKQRADAAAAEAKRIKANEEQKEKDEKNAAELAKKAAELANKLPGEAADVARQNADAAALQAHKDKTGQINADVSAFGADKSRINADIATIAREQNNISPEAVAKAKAAHDDLVAAFNDAMSVVQQLAGMGEDTKNMQTQLAQLRTRIEQVANSVDHH